MDSNPAIAWIILSITLAFFAFVIIWMIWANRNWAWPKGERFTATYKGFRGTVILTNGAFEELNIANSATLSGTRLAEYVAKSAWATDEAWRTVKPDPTHDPEARLSHVVAKLMTDKEFNGTTPDEHEIRSNVSALLVKVGKRVGGEYLPLAVTRTKFVDRIEEAGQPLIHEWCHQLVWDAPNDGIKLYDYRHEDPRIWIGPGKQHSLEHHAVERFKAG
jgi:hypothetical protein